MLYTGAPVLPQRRTATIGRIAPPISTSWMARTRPVTPIMLGPTFSNGYPRPLTTVHGVAFFRDPMPAIGQDQSVGMVVEVVRAISVWSSIGFSDPPSPWVRTA